MKKKLNPALCLLLLFAAPSCILVISEEHSHEDDYDREHVEHEHDSDDGYDQGDGQDD